MIREGRSWSGRERNCCFLNTADGKFSDISAVSGFDFIDDSRALAVGDWDGDGDPDLWVSNRNAPRLRFLRNDAAPPGSFLSLKLQGDGKNTSLDAVGAWVEVQEADGKAIDGHLLPQSADIFGDEIERVVAWDSGTDVSALAGRPVRLRFTMKDADLYSFQFVETR